MRIFRPQKGGEHLDQCELHWTNTLTATEHFDELPPVVSQADSQTTGGGQTDSLLPAASCIQPQILYTVPVLQKKKSAKQPMQVSTSTMDMPMKKEAALNAPEGMALNSVKLP